MKKTITREQVVEVCDFCQENPAYWHCTECKKAACHKCAGEKMERFRTSSSLISSCGGGEKYYTYHDGDFCKEHEGTYLYDGYKSIDRMIRAIEKLDARCENVASSLRR